MTVESLSRQQARRFLLAYHGLLPPRRLRGKAGVLDYIRRVGSIQYDPLNIVGRNPDLVLQARVSDYRSNMLQELLYQELRLLDGWDKMASIYPLEHRPLFAPLHDAGKKKLKGLPDAVQRLLPLVRQALGNGPLCSLSLPGKEQVPMGWTATRAARVALESLFWAGETVINHRVNTRKYYTFCRLRLPAHNLRGNAPWPDREAFLSWWVLRRITSMGLVWDRSGDAWLGMGIPARRRKDIINALVADAKVLRVHVAGISQPFLLPRKAASLLVACCNRKKPRHAAVLAPLDNMLWDRRMVEALFDFAYVWEVYKPKPKRQYGYYVLPVLYGDELVARFEPVFDKRARRLAIRNWWWQPRVRRTKACCRPCCAASMALEPIFRPGRSTCRTTSPRNWIYCGRQPFNQANPLL